MFTLLTITSVHSHDLRFPLSGGAGSDAVHQTPEYAYSVCQLITDDKVEGIGLAFTLGAGNHLVCQTIEMLAKYVKGKEIEELMSNFGFVFKKMAEDPNLRWLGPHKGVVHLALASVVNACWDLWAKSRGVPLWQLLLDLSPEELVATLDFSYYEVLSRETAIKMLNENLAGRPERKTILAKGYPGYDTSIGWFHYTDEEVRNNIWKAMDKGFTAIKLKVGSTSPVRDIRRARLVRETAGNAATIMFDANQQWDLFQAISICGELKELNPYY